MFQITPFLPPCSRWVLCSKSQLSGGCETSGARSMFCPHANAGWWERVRAAWAEPVADAEALEGRLSQLHGSSVDIAALRQLAAFYPETEGTFFHTTLPCIIQLGLRLPEFVHRR